LANEVEDNRKTLVQKEAERDSGKGGTMRKSRGEK
jgi:hypothetical protein